MRLTGGATEAPHESHLLPLPPPPQALRTINIPLNIRVKTGRMTEISSDFFSFLRQFKTEFYVAPSISSLQEIIG
jgi:hypothetical protein